MCQPSDEFEYFLKTLGKNINKVRKNINLSQEQLAFNIDSARNYIGCIERAEKVASLKTLFKIAKVLNTTVENLLKNTME